MVQIKSNGLFIEKTRKSSCVTARGVLPAAYPVHGMCCLEGRQIPCPGFAWGSGRGCPVLGLHWGTPSPPWPGPGQGSPSPSQDQDMVHQLPLPLGKELGPETGVSLSSQKGLETREETWDQRPWGTPPPPPVAFPLTSYADGNKH